METFKKRQKEMLRLEKQREKTARRLAKKRGTLHDPTIPDPDDENNLATADAADAGETSEPAEGSASTPAEGSASAKDGTV